MASYILFFTASFSTYKKKKEKQKAAHKEMKKKIPMLIFLFNMFLFLELWEWGRRPRSLRVSNYVKKGLITWEPSFKLALYANNKFEKYISEKRLHDAIREVYPVPNNLNQTKKMDKYLKDLLKEKKNYLAIYEVLEKKKKCKLRDGSIIYSLIKIGECQEVWSSSFIFRRDSKSYRTNHLFTWSNQ